ncbi:transketolase [Sedimentisphaera salicampi]|uniref:transketolase n=1 Tax=Sedimentisphaera salicampi TaxID=1941349 RepID=UPI000B9C3378|nr:transketolase [Sedimentisphaera salicampi]OXU15814.1 Transketolase [Sedimentisphaera salicampi]
MGKIENKCVETVRFLSAEGVQAAKSGHPGMAMGMAALGVKLWTEHMNHSPQNPQWPNRDRFILSAGHGSMLLYSLLHLTGYDLPLEDLKRFRQLGSLTPGHPEYGKTAGVEATTGPLGQGLSNGVGMAIAQKYLASRYNKEGFNLFDYNIYVVSGDGCMQEGISSEACSLAGHLGLDNLVLIYDDNSITIDGDTGLSFTEDVAERFRAYGWDVQEVTGDGGDLDKISQALENAKKCKGKPSMIKLQTKIGFGAPTLEGTSKSHGAPLGDDEITQMKSNHGWDPDKHFHVPEEVKEYMHGCIEKGEKLEKNWNELFRSYKEKYPELAEEYEQAMKGNLPVNIDDVLPEFEAGEALASRKASGKAIAGFMPKMPLVLGGSADLTPSNNTDFPDMVSFQKDAPNGRYIRYGVREHAMGAILNGISLTKPLRCYGGTFLVFSDYMRGSLRVAAISGYPSIYVFTHDSIGVGEDGPTHQPVEQLSALRAMPGLTCIRPADANETAMAWKYALTHNDGPVAMFLTRQKLTTLDRIKYAPAQGAMKGAYTLNCPENPKAIIFASGSEVEKALDAADKLAEESIEVRVVSMPSWEIFEQQDEEYKRSVLSPEIKVRIAMEAGVEMGWRKYIGEDGIFIGMKGFGTSAPCNQCFEHFGITSQAAVEAVKSNL